MRNTTGSLGHMFRLVVLLLAATLFVACGGGGSDPAPIAPDSEPATGTVSGLVVSAITGAAIPGATIRAGTASVTSAADGSYTLTAGVNERAIISIAAVGFAETFQVARLADGLTAALEVQLLPVGVTQPITIAAGGTVTVPDSSAQVTIPAGGLVSATGGAPATTVNVSLTPINPAIDSRVMPGDFTALLTGSGTPVAIESFGALLVDVRDASGTRYNLAEGQTSTIRIPVGSLSASPPPTIPLLMFNETTGRWVEEGTATLTGPAQNQFYTGTVKQFGRWNADQAMNTVMVSGCVRDTANQPVENVSVKADGVNYSGSASTYTAADGGFRLAVRRDGLVTISVTFLLNGKPVTATVNAGPFTADTTLPSCIETVPVPLAITARLLPAGIVGTPYNARLAATNGTKPYYWSFSGAMPTGLTLDQATGQISGTPTTAATFSGGFEVQDSSTPVQSATTPFTITVTAPAPLAIITGSTLPNGSVGTAYNASLTAANGTQPYAWSFIAGNLPTGLTLSTTGQISGTPTVAGTFLFTIRAQDSSMQSVTAPFNIIVAAPAPFGITTSLLPAGIVGSAYSTSLAAANGTQPYVWSLITGALPTGLTLSSTGQISGTPTVAGVFPVTIEAQDSTTPAKSASASLSITVTAPDTTPPTVISTTPANSATAVAINSPISATFSENMSVATLTPVTFSVNGVAGTVTHLGTTVTFTPSGPLTTNTSYTATIATGVSDAAGNAMTSAYSWSFTTQQSGSDLTEKIGVWEGEGLQPGFGTWTIKVTIKAGEQLIEYPSLRCGGILTLSSATNTQLTFREKITFGGCVDNGFVELADESSNKLIYRWYYPDTNNSQGSLGATGSVTLVTPEADFLALAKKSGCLACHSVEKTVVGPALRDVANKYKGDAAAKAALVAKVKAGGNGNWTAVTGGVPMPPYSPRVTDANIEKLVDFILGLAG